MFSQTNDAAQSNLQSSHHHSRPNTRHPCDEKLDAFPRPDLCWRFQDSWPGTTATTACTNCSCRFSLALWTLSNDGTPHIVPNNINASSSSALSSANNSSARIKDKAWGSIFPDWKQHNASLLFPSFPTPLKQNFLAMAQPVSEQASRPRKRKTESKRRKHKRQSI